MKEQRQKGSQAGSLCSVEPLPTAFHLLISHGLNLTRLLHYLFLKSLNAIIFIQSLNISWTTTLYQVSKTINLIT